MPDAKFDTLAAMQKLQDAGVAEQQAKATVTAISESQRNLATKSDLQTEAALLRTDMETEFKLVRSDMEAEFKLVRSEMEAEFKLVRSEMDAGFKLVRSEIANSERSIIIKLGTLIVAMFTILGASIALIQLLL